MKSATVAGDYQHTKSYGYGYVAFTTEEEQLKCLRELQNYSIQGRQITISIKNEDGQPRGDPEANIIVRNLPKNVT